MLTWADRPTYQPLWMYYANVCSAMLTSRALSYYNIYCTHTRTHTRTRAYVYWVEGMVALPPDEAVLAATKPLLDAGLESGVCVVMAPHTLLSGNAAKAVPTLVEEAVKFNFTTIIMDVEPYPGTYRSKEKKP